MSFWLRESKISLIRIREVSFHPLASLIQECQMFLSMCWQCEIGQIYQEKTDFLASYELSLDLCYMELQDPSLGYEGWLDKDSAWF